MYLHGKLPLLIWKAIGWCWTLQFVSNITLEVSNEHIIFSMNIDSPFFRYRCRTTGNLNQLINSNEIKIFFKIKLFSLYNHEFKSNMLFVFYIFRHTGLHWCMVPIQSPLWLHVRILGAFDAYPTAHSICASLP